jgi:large subunit ribosomal protein L34e
MVRPKLRSRSLKRKKVRTPGNRLITRYEKRRPHVAKCTICKKPLHGVPRLNPVELRKLAKTKRRPERPYGGNLCSSCMRDLLRKTARDTFKE